MPHGLLRLPERASWRRSGSSDPCCRFPWQRWNPCRGKPCIFFPGYSSNCPGLSSQPANMLPIMQTFAPAAMALVISPEYLIPPSAMIGIPYSLATCVAVHDRCDLRNTDTGNHTGGTDGTGSDTNLNGIRTCLDQSLWSLLRWQRCPRSPADPDMLALIIFSAAQYVFGMTVCGIHER